MRYRITKDETRFMDLEAGTWRSPLLSPPPEVEKPTYEVVGPSEQYDCRDHVFARIPMREGTPAFEDYYQRHPEKRDYDDRNRRLAKKSGVGLVESDPINEQLALSSFSRAWIMSRPDYLYHTASMRLLPVGWVRQKQVVPDPHQMARKIKALGLHLGAGKVRIARLDQIWVYSHKPIPEYGEPYDLDYPNVVCLAVPQNPYFMATHTGLSQTWEVGWTYSYATFISYAVADFIRRLGWRARPIPTLNTPYLVPPLFIDCGIGEDARCGYTVAKEFGNNWRPGGVATDLPLAPDKPVDFGLQDFCDKCGICADTCPSGAIPKNGREVVAGFKRWRVDGEKCYAYWNSIGRPCGICQAVCPWNHTNSWFHNGVREVAQRFPGLGTALVKAEEIFYSQQPKPDPAWMTEKVDCELTD
jgi:reductive dehalogenase